MKRLLALLALAAVSFGCTPTLLFPTTGLNKPIRDQSTNYQRDIDNGNVVATYGCMPHGGCTTGWRVIWLAAHRSTAGSPFASVPNLRTGNIIYLNDREGHRHSYQVTGRDAIRKDATWSTFVHGDLMVQTSCAAHVSGCEGHGADHVLIVFAVRLT